MLSALNRLPFARTKKARNMFIGDNAMVMKDIASSINSFVGKKFEQIEALIKAVAKKFGL
jgi:hypothetical protein